MESCLKQLWRDQGGQELAEYALLLLFAVVSISAMVNLAVAIHFPWSNAANNLSSSM
jgi:Flp pilus assembly pilin Flp